MAQKRGKTKKIITVKLDDLTGGMNIAESPEFIKDNEVVRLENMEFDVVGSKLRTLRGLSTPHHDYLVSRPTCHVAWRVVQWGRAHNCSSR